MIENAKTGIGITETGNLDRKQLETMKVADLKRLAADMGVEVSNNAKKDEIVNILAAIEIDTDAAALETSETAATAGAETVTISKTEKVKADAPAAEKQAGQKIYVGASVPGMKKNTVFTGKIPAVLDVPFVRELCIELESVSEFYKKMAVTSSREAFCYRKSVEYAQTLKK